MDTLPEIKVSIGAVLALSAQVVKENPGFITWMEGIPSVEKAIQTNSHLITTDTLPALKAIFAMIVIAWCIWCQLKKEFREEGKVIYIPFSAFVAFLPKPEESRPFVD